MKKWLEKIIKIVRQQSIPLFIIWLVPIMFLGIDGLSRNSMSSDLAVFLSGVYNYRNIIFLPLWIILLCGKTKLKESKWKKFWEDNSLLIFIVLLNISNFMEIFSYESYIAYIIRLCIYFLSVITVICFIRQKFKVSPDESFHCLEKSEKECGWTFSKKEIMWMILLIAGAVITRFISLDGLPPTTDEYLHLGQAKKEILPESVLYNNGGYDRAYFITSILKMFFNLFGMTVVTARLPGVIISCITILLFYLLLRKENKTIAILTSFLYAFSPWSIMLSRTIREYIYFLPFYLLVGIHVYKQTKKVIERNFRVKDIIFSVAVFSLVAYYSFLLDSLSTAKFVLIIYLGGFIYWLINKLKERKRTNSFKLDEKVSRNILFGFLFVFIILVLINKIFGLSIEVSQISIIPSFNASWLGYIFLNKEYGSLIFGGVFLTAGLISSFIKLFKEEKLNLSSYMLIIFLTILYFFTFHFGRYFRPRYISIILPFIVYIQAEGFLCLKNFLCRELKILNKQYLLVLLLLINWGYVFYGFLAKETGYVKISQEFHEGYGLVYEEIQETEDDYVLVTTLPDAADWYFDSEVSEIYPLSYSNPNMESVLDEIVRSNEKGFLVIDYRRNTWAGNVFNEGSPYITKSGCELEYVSSADVYMIYKWNKSFYACN